MQKLIHLMRKPPRVWLMAAQALALSGYYRWRILHRPFADLAPHIGTQGLETPAAPLDEGTIRAVQYAVVGVCSHTPWQSRCLVQALTAKRLLNRRGFACMLYMGVRKDHAGQMIAHAWLRCGCLYVTGGRGHLYYAVTGIYGDAE